MSSSLGSISDGELVRRIGGGDVAALGTLYDRHAPLLLGIALRIVADRSEAEDVVHDAFVAVNGRADQYDAGRGSVAAWLVILVRNLSIDRTRRRARQGTLRRDVVAHEPKQAPETPETLTSNATEGARVRRALASLTDIQRQTLELAFFDGLSYAEIAARESVPIGTIKSRAARAIAMLREAITIDDDV